MFGQIALLEESSDADVWNLFVHGGLMNERGWSVDIALGVVPELDWSAWTGMSIARQTDLVDIATPNLKQTDWRNQVKKWIWSINKWCKNQLENWWSIGHGWFREPKWYEAYVGLNNAEYDKLYQLLYGKAENKQQPIRNTKVTYNTGTLMIYYMQDKLKIGKFASNDQHELQ